MASTIDSNADELLCIKCAYFLRGTDRNSACPECGTPVRDSITANGNAKLYRYENKILSRERAYRANRSGAIALAAVSLFGLTSIFWARRFVSISVPPEFVSVSFCSIPMWLAIAFANHARLKHVESIKHARSRS